MRTAFDVYEPELTIIIPMHNPGEHLPGLVPQLNALEGLIDHEVIFVDDLSSDGSLPELAKTIAQNPNWHLITLSQNGGAGRARNSAMGQARGQYLYFFDADDQFHPDGLRALIDTALTHEADIAIAPYEVANEIGGESREMRRRDINAWEKLREIAPSGAFKIDEVPQVLGMVPYSHYRIVRRAFAEQTEFRYSPQPISNDLLPHWVGLLRAERLAWSDKQVSTYILSESEHRMSNYADERRLFTFDSVNELKDAVSRIDHNIPGFELIFTDKIIGSIFAGFRKTNPEKRGPYEQRILALLEAIPADMMVAYREQAGERELKLLNRLLDQDAKKQAAELEKNARPAAKPRSRTGRLMSRLGLSRGTGRAGPNS